MKVNPLSTHASISQSHNTPAAKSDSNGIQERINFSKTSARSLANRATLNPAKNTAVTLAASKVLKRTH